MYIIVNPDPFHKDFKYWHAKGCGTTPRKREAHRYKTKKKEAIQTVRDMGGDPKRFTFLRVEK